MLDEFIIFGVPHCIALAVCFFVGAWYIVEAQASDEVTQFKMGKFLALLLVATYPLSLLTNWLTLPSMAWQEMLPFQMCSIIPYVAAGALVWRCPFMSAVTFFMGTVVCLQALITPALEVSFPHVVALVFFFNHALILIAAFYLLIVYRWRPRPWDFLSAWIFGLIYMIGAGGANSLLGTNYGFLSYAPKGGSVLDLLGPWPWYLLGVIALAFLVMVVVDVIFTFSFKVNWKKIFK